MLLLPLILISRLSNIFRQFLLGIDYVVLNLKSTEPHCFQFNYRLFEMPGTSENSPDIINLKRDFSFNSLYFVSHFYIS